MHSLSRLQFCFEEDCAGTYIEFLGTIYKAVQVRAHPLNRYRKSEVHKSIKPPIGMKMLALMMTALEVSNNWKRMTQNLLSGSFLHLRLGIVRVFNIKF